MQELQNKKWTRDEFESVRKDVLTQWSTGKDVDIDKALAYHKALPKRKNFSYILNKAKEEGQTLTQPRAGVPLIQDQINLLQYLQDEGEADLLPTTIDSYTR
ncbi:MAG: methylaspartate mutase subunit E, partial [Eubacteriales bacterium]|nr:methylaspartate mutase subunit E [Eubacteriales bacterium]